MTLKTSYEFTLPRGYVDHHGAVHRTGVMRLATARDELEPLRDPTILGPDDPRLTVVVLARVVETLGSLELVTPHEIEGLFAADLAYLQDFYGIINFGSQDEYEAFVTAHAPDLVSSAIPDAAAAGSVASEESAPARSDAAAPAVASDFVSDSPRPSSRPGRAAIEEIAAPTS